MSAAGFEVLAAGIVVADHVCAPISHLPAAGELVLSERMQLSIGGCAANVAVNLRKLGVRATIVGRVGLDFFADFLRHALQQADVSTAGLLPTPGQQTSQTLIVNVAGQDRRFIHHFGANAAFQATDVPSAWLADAKVLYVGGYLLMPALTQEPLANLFAAARRQGVRTVLDVACPAGVQLRDQFDKLLPVTDVFLPNRDEAASILGEDDPQRQAMCFREMGAGTVAITCGRDGALWVDGQHRWRAGAFAVTEVDASGSGDAFTAGVIFGLLHGFSAADCLRWGSALGASCVQTIGTTEGVFNLAQAKAFLAAHELPLTAW
jgi:sugar/nucleoside kinase (ribokinase family)